MEFVNGAPCSCETRVLLHVVDTNPRDGQEIGETVNLEMMLKKGTVEKVIANLEHVTRAQSARQANALVSHCGPRLTKNGEAMKNPNIAGVTTTQQAIEVITDKYKNRRRMQITPEMIANARKMGPERIQASTIEEILHLSDTRRKL